jgi:hypothetical protein
VLILLFYDAISRQQELFARAREEQAAAEQVKKYIYLKKTKKHTITNYTTNRPNGYNYKLRPKTPFNYSNHQQKMESTHNPLIYGI